MTNYYIEKDNKIIFHDVDRQRLENTIASNADYSSLEIKETERPIVDFEFTDTPEYLGIRKSKLKKNITNVYQAKFEELKSSYLAKIGLGTSSEEAYRTQYQALRTALVAELANV